MNPFKEALVSCRKSVYYTLYRWQLKCGSEATWLNSDKNEEKQEDPLGSDRVRHLDGDIRDLQLHGRLIHTL